ncbi:MAG: TfoX/Sxy family DNA transformation protein [Candidatus Aminicenantes bacterium]|nr:TfoX/Sxy family DNA transformation protein [Candidatus Aminicenantes bacterium]
MSSTDSLRQLSNIGAVTEKKLKRIGIFSKEDFLIQDPYEVFEELRQKVDPTLCRCVLASIVGAKRGLPWHQITKASAREYEKRHPGHIWGKC